MEKQWVLMKSDENLSKTLSDSMGITQMLSRLLVNRGMSSVEDAKRFLKPDFAKHRHSPFLFKDMKKASQRIIKMLDEGEKVVIFGDYDADGITATALLYNFFKLYGITKKREVNVDYILPDRVKDGYGMTASSVDKANEMKANLIITVDNGVSSYDAVERANEIGIDVIITDHHLITNELPNAYAIINPHLDGCEYPNKNLVGVGVAYKLVEALSDVLFDESEKDRILQRFIDLVAIGTYQDVAILVGENRLLVKCGIDVLKQIVNEKLSTNLNGIKEMMKIADPNSNHIDYKTLGFVIGPRINACGRVGLPDKALELLITTDEKQAKNLALDLNGLNSKRQSMKRNGVKDAMKTIEQEGKAEDKLIFITSNTWHKGVIGLIASEVKDFFYRPTIVATDMGENDIYCASCRSIDGFNIGRAVSKLGHLCISYGGHENAAGFSLVKENLDEFKEKMYELASNVITKEMLIPRIMIDHVVNSEDINFDLLNDVIQLQPFGEGNDEPIFELDKAIIIEVRQSKRAKDSLITFTKGNKRFFGVCFNNVEFVSRYSSGDYVNISFKINKSRKRISAIDIEIIDMQ